MSRCSTPSLASDRPTTAGATPPLTAGPIVPANGTTIPSAAPRDRDLKFAALYARVSTEKQAQEATIASQLAALQERAAVAGYTVPAEYVFCDEGFSGARLDRPALDRLRDLAAEGALAAVLIYAPDRLARQYAYQVVVRDELVRTGCQVLFLNHAFGTSPAEQMLLQIQGVFAEYERAVIRERTRRGRLFAARQGRVNWGRAPYGYCYLRRTETTPQQLVIQETEAAVVRQIYQWLIAEALSSYALAKRLTAEAVPTRTGQDTGWRQSSVMEILRDPLYKGEGYFNRTQTVDAHRPYRGRGYKDCRPGNGRGRAERPREEWIPVAVPPLIAAATWEAAPAQLVRNREHATRNNTKHDYLLRGLVVCGRCGRRMIGTWSASGGRYVCGARYPRHAPHCCDGRSVAATKLDEWVWDYIRELLADGELLRARYAEGHADPAVEQQAEAEQERIERQLGALAREVQRLIDAYQAGAIELAELQERRQRNEDYGRGLRERLAQLQQQRQEREQEIRLLAGLDEFCASVRAALADPSFTLQQKVLQLVVDRIVIEEDRIVIQHIIPTGPVRLQTEPNVVRSPFRPAPLA